MKKKKKILIIGGTGFIGFHLANQCIKKKWDVVSISTKKPIKKRFVKNVKYLNCDISKKKNLKNIVKKNFDFVVNLGGHVDHKNYNKTLRSHFLGVKNLAGIFSNTNLKLFIQIGSGGEYGQTNSPHIEGKEKLPKTIYNKSKFLASKFLFSLAEKKNFPVTVLRLYQVYGPKQDINRLIPIAIFNCIKNNKFPCSNGKQLRNFIYIDDVVRSIFKCLQKWKKVKGEIINIGSNKNYQVKKLIETIKNKIGKGEPQFGKIPLRADEKFKFYPAINKAKKILGWEAKINLNKGLDLTIKDFKNLIN